MTKKVRKRLLIILAVIVVFVVIIGLFLNLILGSFMSKAVNAELSKISTESELNITIDNVKINVFSRTLIFKGISVKVDSSYFEEFKLGKANKPTLTEFYISDLRLRGFDISNLIFDKHLDLRKILIKGVDLTLYKTDKYIKKITKKTPQKSFDLDSIHIKGLHKIDLSKIEIDKFSLRTINANNGDTINSYNGNQFEIRGISLDSHNGSEGYFKINTKKLNLKLRQQRFDLKGGNYFVYFKKLDFYFADSTIKISDFMFKPARDKYKIAASLKYTQEVIDVEVKAISIHGLKVGDAIRYGIVDIDSILIDKLKIELYKDKNKPWNYDKRPMFLQQKLKHLKQPLHIDMVKVSNSKLIYSERPKDSKKLLVVDISNMSAQLDFVTSIRDSLRSGKNLKINLKGYLMNTSHLNLDVVMPYNSRVDTFYFAGYLGPADFVKFNPAIYPATGIKFDAGKLESVKFSANASPKRAEGKMTMIYSGLEAEVTKKDVEEKDKALSWLANVVLPKSNPSKKGKLKVAKIEVDRVEYKGLGNFIWKSVQSGLVNTILPTGKKIKQEQIAEPHTKKETKKKRKRRRDRKK